MSQWNGDAILNRLQSALVQGLDDAGAIAVRSERDLLKIPGPPASAPGDPPHRRSGDLQASQAHRAEREGSGGVLVIQGAPTGSPAEPYGRHVAKRRPWLAKGVDEVKGQILETVADSLRRELR